MPEYRRLFPVVLVALLVGCTGTLTDPAGSSPSSAGGQVPGAGLTQGGTTTGGAGTTSTPDVLLGAGPMPLRRLTRFEYNNTVADLLGNATHPADDFPPDEHIDKSPFPSAPLVDSLWASRLADAAAALAAAAAPSKLLPCSPTAVDESACAGQFIDKFGARAYRRPVLAAERARLLALYQDGRMAGGLDFTGGIRLVIEAMLQSPGFLYHWELGPQTPELEGKLVRLGPYEVASRVSYFLWGSMPDDSLLAAAAANQLRTEDQVATQVQRMLNDERAQSNIVSFFEEWLGLTELSQRTKDEKVYPEFTDTLRTAMTDELRALTTSVVFDGDGRLETLLTGTSATVAPPLDAIYGMKDAGSAPQPLQLNPAERSGLLTRAGFQALYGGSEGSHPIKRGSEIYTRVLCKTLPPPPANVPPPKPASEGGTTRSRFAEHSTQACAAGCHALFDNLGFAFENYDGIGRYRTTDNGSPVDASGSFSLDGKLVSFRDGRQLSQLLAESAEVKQCFASQAASFALGRAVGKDDQVSVDAAVEAYGKPSAGIRTLMGSFAASRTFRYRSPAEGEVLQ